MISNPPGAQTRLHLAGLYPVVPTPFVDGRLDTESVRRHIEQLAPHVEGVTVLGSSGEAGYLHPGAWQSVMGAYLNAASAYGIAVIGGLTSASTAVAREQASSAEGAACAALLVLPPNYYAATFEGAERHLRDLAWSVDTPLVHYEIPTLTGLRLGASDLLGLADRVPSLTGIKLAVSDLELVATLKRHGLTLFAAWDELLHEQVVEGCDAVMAPLAAVAPGATRRWFDLQANGKVDQALATFIEELLPICHAMAGADGDFVAAVKVLLYRAGTFASAEVLPGMPNLTPARVRQVQAVGQYVEARSTSTVDSR